MENESVDFKFGDVVVAEYGDGEDIKGIFLSKNEDWDCCDIAEQDGGISFEVWLGRVKLLRRGNFYD